MHKYLFILLICSVGVVPGAMAQVAKTNEVVSLRDGLKSMLQARGAASLKKLSINVDAENAAILREQGVSATGTYTVYRGLDAGGEVIGNVLVVNERGKEGPLQLLVAFNSDDQLYDVGFTLFGEDKGKPALNWSFLRQFLDQDASRVAELNVDGVSGATWTTDSVTSAINRAAALYALFLAGS